MCGETKMPDERILFLYGNDEFAIARRLNELQAAVDKDGMNTARLEARTVSEDELNTAVNSAPFLAARRLAALANPSARYATPEAREKFFAFLGKAPTTTLLVLQEAIEPKEEEKHWLVKRAGKAGIKAERFMLPRAWEMTGWIVRETEAQGGQIEESAAARLAEMVGEHTRQAAQEIAKLLTYVNWARPITLQDVEQASVVTAQASIFAMVDALANGDTRQAQALMHRLLEEEDPFQMWGMVIRQFRLLILAREVIDGRGTLQEARQSIHEAPYSVEKAYKQAGRLTMAALEGIYHKLLEIDEGVKTGQVTLEMGLEMLVVDLARK